MRKFMKIINEAANPMADEFDGIVDSPVDASFDDMFQKIFGPLHQLHNRMQIEAVYMLVLDGIPLDDAINHIAGRDEVDPVALRDLVVSDYKIMRGNPDTYENPQGHALVQKMNAVVRESLEEAARAHDSILMEKSQKVGSYFNDNGDAISIHCAEHDPKHHMVINKKGEVTRTIHASPEEVHDELTKDGFKGKMHKA